MIRFLVMDCTKKLNIFPVKGGVSDYFSPHMLLKHKNLDYDKHCLIPFGAFVQVNHEPEPLNSNAPRTLDAIFLHATNTIQGGHEVMDLNSRSVITHGGKVTEIPVTTLVIKAVKNMAKCQGFKSLKFKNRHGVVFHDTDWIAGVDYEESNNKNKENENEEVLIVMMKNTSKKIMSTMSMKKIMIWREMK